MSNKPPCIDWAEKLALRREDLTSFERVALDAHTSTCAVCAVAAANYQLLIVRIRALPEPTVKPLPRLSHFEQRTGAGEQSDLKPAVPLQLKRRTHVIKVSNESFERFVSVLVVASIILGSLVLFQRHVPTSTSAVLQLMPEHAATFEHAALFQESPYFPGMGNVALDDPLSNNSKGYNWDTNAHCVFTGGAYHISDNEQGFFYPCFARNVSFSNFTYEVQVTFVQGDANNSGGGIIFRSVDDTNIQFYAFTIRLDGSYTLFAHVNPSGSSARLLAGGSTPAIRTGLHQSNLVAVVTNGNTISLYANHQFITRVSDITYSEGDIGLFAYNDGTLVEGVFSNARVWT
jgi:hypothetical protein